MLSKYTIVGMIIGCIITGLGIYGLIDSLSNPLVTYEKTVDIGSFKNFDFDAMENFHEILNVTGSSFHVKIETPDDGLQVDEDFKIFKQFDWFSLKDGVNRINITNTGDSEAKIYGKFQAVANPLVFPFHMLLIISGIIIIGVSAGFTIRKPRGF